MEESFVDTTDVKEDQSPPPVQTQTDEFSDEIEVDEEFRMEQQILFLKRKLQEQSDELVKLKLEHTNCISSKDLQLIQNRHQSELKILRDQLSDAKHQVHRTRTLSQTNLLELTDTQSRLREYEEQLHEQEQKHERRLSEQQETFEAKIEELLKEKTRINRQKMQIEQSLQLEMDNVTRKHQSEIEKLKKRLRETASRSSTAMSNTRILALEDELTTLDAEHQEDIDNLVTEHEREIHHLRAEMRVELSGLETENRQLREQCRKLLNKNRELNARTRDNGRMNQLERRADELCEENAALKSEVDRLNQESEAIRIENVELTTRVETLEDQLAVHQDQAAQRVRRHSSVIFKDDESQTTVVVINQNSEESDGVSVEQKQRHQLQQSMTDLLERYSKEVDELREALAAKEKTMEEERSAADGEAEKWLAQKQRLRFKLAQYQHQLKTLKDKHKTDLKQVTQQISSLQSENMDAEKSLLRMKEKYEKRLQIKEADLEIAEQKIEDLNAHIAELEDNIVFIEAEREETMKKVLELQQDIQLNEELENQYEEELKQMDTTLDGYKTHIEVLEFELRESKTQLDVTKKRMSDVTVQLNQHEQEIAHSKRDSLHLAKEKADLLKKYHELEELRAEEQGRIHDRSVEPSVEDLEKLKEQLKWQLRQEVIDDVRTEVRSSVVEEVREEMKSEVLSEVETKVRQVQQSSDEKVKKLSQQFEQDYIDKINMFRDRVESRVQETQISADEQIGRLHSQVKQKTHKIMNLEKQVKQLNEDLERTMESKSTMINSMSAEMERLRAMLQNQVQVAVMAWT